MKGFVSNETLVPRRLENEMQKFGTKRVLVNLEIRLTATREVRAR